MRLLFILFIAFFCQSSRTANETGSNVTSKDAKAALEFHNKARKEVGAPDLIWSNDLATFAQQWANHLAEECKMKHRPRTGKWVQKYGENIFWGSSTVYTVTDACKSWYSEKENFTGPTFTGHEANVVGHYTQMIWRKTTKLGIGIAKCSGGGVIIVANYDPPGNYLGENAY
jgi:uncharacterized protein YkwD